MMLCGFYPQTFFIYLFIVCGVSSWYVSSVLLTMLSTGMVFGFTPCFILALQAPDSTIVVNVGNMSWLVASFGFASMFGYLVMATLMYKFGRRTTYGIVLLPALLGMLLTFCAADVTTLVCGRILTGVTGGATAGIAPVIIGEYCTPQYRGMFLNMKTAGVYLGSTLAHVLGYHIHWKTVALMCCIPYALALLVTYTWPESPSWLVQKRRFRESEEVFYHLRGTSALAVREIKELIRAQKAVSIKKKNFLENIIDFGKKFTRKNFLKPLLISVFIAILLETSGRHIFPSFATQIITRITVDSQLFYYTLSVDILMTVSVLFSAYLIKVVKLRKLLFITGSVSCIVLCLACLHLFLEAIEVIPKGYSAVPITLFGLFFVFGNLGCAPIPCALTGEIFPLEHRAVGAAVAGYLQAFMFTIVLKITPIMLHSIDIYGTFAVLALCMAISLFVLYFIVPETKDRTLQEIEEFYEHGKFVEVSNCNKEDVKQMICKKESIDV